MDESLFRAEAECGLPLAGAKISDFLAEFPVLELEALVLELDTIVVELRVGEVVRVEEM